MITRLELVGLLMVGLALTAAPMIWPPVDRAVAAYAVLPGAGVTAFAALALAATRRGGRR